MSEAPNGMWVDGLLTLQQAAQLTQCSTETLRRAIRKRELAHTRACGIRFTREQLERWWSRKTITTSRRSEPNG